MGVKKKGVIKPEVRVMIALHKEVETSINLKVKCQNNFK